MLELLLNPGRRRKSRRRRSRRNPATVMGLVRAHKAGRPRHLIPSHRQKLRVKTGMWTNPVRTLRGAVSVTTNTALPMAIGAVANSLLRPRIQSALNIAPTPFKNAAVGIGSAVLIALGAGFVAKKYAGKVAIGALVQTAVTTVIEVKSAYAAPAVPELPAPAPLPVALPAPTTTKGMDGEDDLEGYTPDFDLEAEL